MNIRYNVRGLKEAQTYLKTIPRGGLKAGLKALVEYLIGNSSHGLKHDEPQKYVSRKAAGYKTSRKQMAYFFAVGILERVGNGIKLNRYKRTGETSRGYQYVMVSDYKFRITNPQEGAHRTRGEPGQTRQHQLAGRRSVSKVIADNMAGAMRSANAAVRSFLSRKK